MGIAERKQRQKDDTRLRIVDAALQIGKADGWNALSMRKIGDIIEYSAPVVYEHFENKEALLLELTRIGYKKLIKEMRAVVRDNEEPARQLEAMWLVYWKFAFTDNEFYQLMFGIETNCSCHGVEFPEALQPGILIREIISKMIPDHSGGEDAVSKIYYTFWSVVHGLISLNMIGHEVSKTLNDQVLNSAISGVIDSIAAT